MDALELLLHPIRIRIVNAFSGDRTRTTSEVCARLPDVSQATVYRHVALLADAGVLEVVDERMVRGGVERHYRLDREQARLDQQAVQEMTLGDHRRAFTAAMAALIADFGSYLNTGTAAPTEDLVGYRQIPLWLTDAERDRLIQRLQEVLAPSMRHKPQSDRRHYLLSPILFPVAEAPANSDNSTDTNHRDSTLPGGCFARPASS
jgi:DNA-binding transcriptional ArsR family regulator